ADREGEHGNRRKYRTTRQAARGVLDVLRDRFDPIDEPHFSTSLMCRRLQVTTDLVETCAEPPERLAARVVGGHAALYEVVDPARDQRVELVVELGADSFGVAWGEAEEATHAGPEIEAHATLPRFSPRGWSTARRSDRSGGAIPREGGSAPERSAYSSERAGRS